MEQTVLADIPAAGNPVLAATCLVFLLGVPDAARWCRRMGDQALAEGRDTEARELKRLSRIIRQMKTYGSVSVH